MNRCAAALVLWSVLLFPSLVSGADREFLIEGVESIATSGVPGPLSVFGPKAFPVIVGRFGDVQQTLVGAARMGRGRVVAFGHTGYLSPETLKKKDTLRLLLNALRWVGKQSSHNRADKTLRVAVFKNEKLTKLLRDNGLDVETLQTLTSLPQFDLLVADPCLVRSDAQFRTLEKYIRSGGGYVASGLGWGWQQLNPGRDLTVDHVGNRLLRSAGLAWADGTLSTTVDGGFLAATSPSPYLNAEVALKALLSNQNGMKKLGDAEIKQALRSIELAAQSLPSNEPRFMKRLRAKIATAGAEVLPTAQAPLTAKQPLSRLLVTLDVLDIRKKVQDQKRQAAHPASTDFPGPVAKNARRVTKKIAIDPSVPDWHSTGLYAAPGEAITVQVPSAIAALKKPVCIRIGAHRDRLWGKDSWKRCPEISFQLPLRAEQVKVSNPFGGLVYVDVPKDCPVSTFEVTIRDAVEAPYYVLGQTDLKQWRERIRSYPAPWAELQTDKVILTVPSEVVRDLDDPQEVMIFWDRVMDACAELAVRPLKRVRPERYVADRQISAGYMHSGYPIMTHLDVRRAFVDMELLRRGNWGFFHEVGHNHQSGLWTFDGTGEVTVNLFTLYIYEKVCGLTVEEARSQSAREFRVRSFIKHRKAGADFAKWKSDPFLALAMYIQLQQEFGWDTFKRVFTEYRDLPRAEQPRTDVEKRDQWLVRFSKATGKNLGPFFELWGVPTSQSARDSIADLPTWIPDELAEVKGK